MAIKSFAHKGLELLWTKGKVAKLDTKLAPKLKRQLSFLHAMSDISDLSAFPSWKAHRLSGTSQGRWSIWVTGNWRLTVEWDGQDIHILNLEDFING